MGASRLLIPDMPFDGADRRVEMVDDGPIPGR